LRCMRTEPTMPRQPTRPTACVMFNALGKMDKKAGYPDNLSECRAEMLHCRAKGACGSPRPCRRKATAVQPAQALRPGRNRNAGMFAGAASAQRLEHG